VTLLPRPHAGFIQRLPEKIRRLDFLALALLLALTGCDDPSAEEFVARAEAYRQERNFSASIIELKNALQKEPRNARARYLLGQTYVAVRNFASAEKELLRARDYGFDPERLAAPLAEIWLTQHQFEKILAQLRADDAASASYRASVAITRARAHRGLGQLEEAEAGFESALTLDPTNVGSLVGIARIAMQLSHNSKAESAVERAYEIAPKDLSVLALKADHEFLRGNYASAESHYLKIVGAGSNNIAVRLALARAQIFLGKPDQAAVHLDAVIGRSKSHPDANYLRASLALRAGDYDGAKFHSEQVLRAFPGHVPSLLIAGAANYVLGQLEQADRYLSGVLAEEPSHGLARRLYASTRVRLGRDAADGSALTPLLDDSLDARQFVAISDPTARKRADLEAGRAYFDELSAEYAGAILAESAPGTAGLDVERSRLRANLEQAPAEVPLLLRLANLESRAGNMAESASLLQRALSADPYGVQAQTLLGQLHLRSGQPAKALRVTEAALRRHPRDRVLLGVVGLARLRLGRAREAKLNFRSLVDLQPESAAAHYLLALAFRDSGDVARFRSQLEQVLARDPGHLRADIDMGRLLAREGALGAARDLAERLQETAPEDSEVWALAGAVALLQSRFENAVALFGRLYARDPTSTAALKLAFVQQRAGDEEGSRATLEHRLERVPDDSDARVVLANKLLYIGELDQARAHYAKIILLRPNNVVALNNLAWVGMRLGQSDTALYAQRAFLLAPDDPRILDTYGLVLLEQEDVDEAVRVLRRAAKGEPNSLEIHAHLARALARQGHDSEAREILRRILSEKAEFPERNNAEDLLKDLRS